MAPIKLNIFIYFTITNCWSHFLKFKFGNLSINNCSLVLIFRVASDLKAESVFRLLFDEGQLLSLLLCFFLLLLHLLVFFLFFIDLLDLLVFEFLLFLFLVHFFFKLYLVLFSVNDIFLFHLILSDQDLLYFFKELTLNLGHTLFNSAAWAGELFTAFFGKLFCIDPVNSQTTDCWNVFMFASVLRVNNHVFILDCLLLLFLLRGLFLLGLFYLLLNVSDIFFFKVGMIFWDFCWCQVIQSFYTQIYILTILAQLEGERACFYKTENYRDSMKPF